MKRQIGFILLCIIVIGKLTGCAANDIEAKQPLDSMQTVLSNSIAISKKAANNTKPPTDVTQALMPSLSVKQPSSTTKNAKRFDIAVNDVPARSFFMGLVDGTSYNIMVDPTVTGTLSLSLKNVTIPQVMEAVRDAYNYEYEQTRVGYRVFSATKLQRQTFIVNYLNVRRSGTSQTEVSSGISSSIGDDEDDDTSSSSGSAGILAAPIAGDTVSGGVPIAAPSSSSSNGTSNTAVATHTSSDFWGTLRTSLREIIGTKDGRSVVLNPQAGVVVVRATPAELREVAIYLDKIQNSMNRQVLIEAKVLEVTLSEGYQQGINWELFGAALQQGNRDLKDSHFQAFGLPTPEEANSGGTINTFNAFTGLVTARNFEATIKLLSTQGTVQVLSSPRITTVNNQKALMKVGKDEFFVTNVSSSTTTTAAAPTSSEGVELTPFFSGIALDITPQIDGAGNVTLHVHPTVVRVTTDESKVIELSDNNILKLPLALSTVRETDSIVHAKNGQVVVIGGLMTNEYTNYAGMTPGVGRIPLVGDLLFNDKERQQQKRELVILLRPIIIDQKSAIAQLKATQKAFKGMNVQQKEMKKPKSIAHWFE